MNEMLKFKGLLLKAKGKTEKHLDRNFFNDFDKEYIASNLLKAFECIEKGKDFFELKKIAPVLSEYSIKYKRICDEASNYIEEALRRVKLYYDYNIVSESQKLLLKIKENAELYELNPIAEKAEKAFKSLQLDDFINHYIIYNARYYDLLKLINKIRVDPIQSSVPKEIEYNNILTEYIKKIEMLNPYRVNFVTLPLVMAMRFKAIENINYTLEFC